MKIEPVEVDFVVFVCLVLPVQGVLGETRKRRKNAQEGFGERKKYYVYFLNTSWRSNTA